MPATQPIQPADTPPRGLPLTTSSSLLTALAITDDAPPLALRSTRHRPRRAVRRGAPAGRRRSTRSRPSRPWPGPSVAASCPSESVLLSGPGLLFPQPASARRSLMPASSGRASSPRSALPGRRPRRRWVVRGQHAVSTHPGSSSGVRRSGRPVSSRPVSGHLVSSSGVRRSGRLVSTRPASTRLVSSPSSVQPSAVHPSGVQPAGVRPSVRTRLSPPTLDGRWDQAGAAGGNRHRRNRSSPGGLPCRGAARSTVQQAWGARRCRGRTLVSGVGGGLAGWVRAAEAARDRLSDQAGQAGVRSARGWRRRGGHGSRRQREVAAAAAWLPSWAGWRPRWVVVMGPAARVGGSGGADGRAGGDGRAAPARPRLAAGAPGSLPAAL
jgi:hypothetical protein